MDEGLNAVLDQLVTKLELLDKRYYADAIECEEYAAEVGSITHQLRHYVARKGQSWTIN